MNHEVDVFEVEPDDLQQVPGGIGSDGDQFGRVGVWFKIKYSDGMLEGVADVRVIDAVLIGRPVDLHIDSYRNT